MESSQPERTLRIGIVTDGLEERIVGGEIRIANGGVGVYIYQLVKHLLETEYPAEFVLMRYGDGHLDIYHHPRVRVVLFPRRRGGLLRRALDLDYRRVALDLALDVIHYPNQFGGAFLPRSIQRVVTLHDLTPLLLYSMHPRTRVLVYRLTARLALRRADRIMVVSDHTGRDVKNFVPDCAKVVVRVYPGVRDKFKPSKMDQAFLARNGLDRRYILTVGVLEPRKNHVLLLTALSQLVARGHDLDLIIIGRKGWHWADPRTHSEFQLIKDRVRILEDVAEHELLEYYRHAAVFTYPSWYEGFGLPVLEAMACGAPVVCSSTSSIPEVGGNAALYADPRDPASFATQIAKLLADEELRSQMIARGLERARQLSWRQTALETMQVYRSVVEARHGCRDNFRPGDLRT